MCNVFAQTNVTVQPVVQICCPGNMYLFQLMFYIRKLFGKNSQIKNTSQRKTIINLSTLCVVLRTVQYIVLLPH